MHRWGFGETADGKRLSESLHLVFRRSMAQSEQHETVDATFYSIP